ncbi:MAG TPA: hypothetical protein VMF61_09940 [Candidatus Acidoferrales bacterium]|nr:hypothetical protein [Candidatus Acidoferrales bacterium]
MTIAAILWSVRQVPTAVPYDGAVGSVAVDPLDARRIGVASIGGGAFGSRDGGRTWRHEDGLASDRVQTIAFLRDGTEVATSARTFEARGGGGLWIRRHGIWRRSAQVFPAGCTPAAGVWGIASGVHGATLYVATDCGMAAGSPDARRWRATTIVGASPPFMSIAGLGAGRIVVGGPNGFWYSRDAGKTFDRETTGIGGITGVRGLWADPRGGGRAYAATDAKALYETTDGGSTWNRIAAGAGSFSCGGDAFVKAVASGSQVALYFGNRCVTRAATFDRTEEPFAVALRWTTLECDHVDTYDLAFWPRSSRPYLMSSDGGLHVSADGTHFHAIAGAAGGLDALQVTSVVGQTVGDAPEPDLYFATQDDEIWALRAGVAAGSLAWEGFGLTAQPSVADDAQSFITYAICGGCKNATAGALLRDPGNWPDASAHQRPPVRLGDSQYVQQAGAGGAGPAALAATADRGKSWQRLVTISQPLRGLPQTSEDGARAVVWQPAQLGTAADGTETVGFVQAVAGTNGAWALRYPRMRGFGSLGVAPAGFAWNEVFSVAPGDPEKAIAVDATDGDVKMTGDYGDTWAPVPALRALMTGDGRYATGERASDRVASLVSAIAFCPDDDDVIAAGTRAGGVYVSTTGGRTWERVAGSAPVTFATSLYWFHDCGALWAATYGRGIWSLTANAPARPPRATPAVSAPAPAPVPSAPPVRIALTSGSVEEGERVLDPHDPLDVTIASVPGAGRFVLAVDGRALTSVAAGLPSFRYSATPPFWPLGHHAVALVDVSQSPAVTVWTVPFIVP